MEKTAAGGGTGSRAEGVAKIGTIVSAIMASSCCWLPPILLVMGVSGAGMTKALESYRYLFMVVTFGFLGMAFYFTYRPRRAAAGAEDCCAPQPSPGEDVVALATDGASVAAPVVKRRFNMMALNKVMLWGVTVMAVVFLFFPQYVRGMFASDHGEITADMQHSVLVVEGMTCEG